MFNKIDKFEIKSIVCITKDRYAAGPMLHAEIIPRPPSRIGRIGKFLQAFFL